MTHSGLQEGGEPIIEGRQVQMARLLISLHWLFEPQGDGLHGFLGTIGSLTLHCTNGSPVMLSYSKINFYKFDSL